MSLRVLVAAHGHPALTRGGAEITAYALFRALLEAGHDAFFLGCKRGHPGAPLATPIFQLFDDPREYLYGGGDYDWLRLANRDPAFPEAFRRLLRDTRPDILHFHHVMTFGVEAAFIAKRALPDLRVVLTLHEYMLACHHHGQMVKRPSRALCYRARPDECHGCFPEIAAEDFALRTVYLRRMLESVDAFVSPSRFLAERMIAWGLPAEKTTILPNMIPLPPKDSCESPARVPGVFTVGFFGQISALKGVGVLLDAAALLWEAGRRDIVFRIHGTMEGTPADLLDDLPERLRRPIPNVVVAGPYQPEQVYNLMSAVDVVCAPSVWWENTPLVFEEAHRAGRPLLYPKISGLSDQALKSDRPFNIGSAQDLATSVCVLQDREGP